jgi:Spy/CpxP family protein refolding chaperone
VRRVFFPFLNICLSVFALQALPVFSFADPPTVNWWHDPHVVETLALTTEQRQHIDKLIQQSLKQRAEIDKKLAPLRRAIPDLLSQPELDERKVLDTLTTLDTLRDAKRKDVIVMRMRVRQVLSPAQFKKLQELSPRIMRQAWVTRQIQGEVKGAAPQAEKDNPLSEDNDDVP